MKRFLPNSDSDDGKILALEAEIRSLDERSQRLLDLVEEGDTNALARYKANAERIAALKNALADERNRIDEIASQGDTAVYVKDLNDLFLQLAAATDENELRIQISQKLRSLFKRVIFDKNAVHIEFEQTASKLKYEDDKIIGREIVSSISRRKVNPFVIMTDDEYMELYHGTWYSEAQERGVTILEREARRTSSFGAEATSRQPKSINGCREIFNFT